jgi:hypothetical protein
VVTHDIYIHIACAKVVTLCFRGVAESNHWLPQSGGLPTSVQPQTSYLLTLVLEMFVLKVRARYPLWFLILMGD